MYNLIQERSKALNQCVRDATVATAIQCLKSIRVPTLDANKRKKFSIKVEDTGWYVGFSNTDKKPCVRNGSSKHAKRVTGLGVVKYYTRGLRQKDAHVYKVTVEKQEIKPYYIGAPSAAYAGKKALESTLRRIKINGGLAKNAIGVAMNKLSNSTNPLIGSNTAKEKSSKAATVEVKKDSESEYIISVVDELEYATMALKGGQGAVEIALKKAANKITGYLMRVGGEDLKQKLQTPFPEVKRPRR